MSHFKTDNAMLSETSFTIEPFTKEHLPDGLRLSQAVSWPHRAEDWALTVSVSEGVVALVDGQVVGTALCSNFGSSATLNMIIVDAAMQGRGLGRALMERVIDIGGPRELRLVATAEGLPLYEKLGFVATGKVLQQQGIAKAVTPEHGVWPGSLADIEQLVMMDTDASGLSRGGLLSAIAQSGEVLVLDGGFALLREFGRGQALGPVVAKDADTARALMAEATRRCAGQFLRIDLDEDCGLADFAQELGLASAGVGIAMHRNATLAKTKEFKTFALVSQALG
jgi:GNAT superfamily N-acetyltransferase